MAKKKRSEPSLSTPSLIATKAFAELAAVKKDINSRKKSTDTPSFSYTDRDPSHTIFVDDKPSTHMVDLSSITSVFATPHVAQSSVYFDHEMFDLSVPGHWEVPSDIPIPDEIKGFSKEQNALLCWLCAVRILPLLTTADAPGRFQYWGEKKKQRYLYSVLHSLDKLAGESIKKRDEPYWFLSDDLQRGGYGSKPMVTAAPTNFIPIDEADKTYTIAPTGTKSSETTKPPSLGGIAVADGPLPKGFSDVIVRRHLPLSCQGAGLAIIRSERINRGGHAALRLIALLVQTVDLVEDIAYYSIEDDVFGEQSPIKTCASLIALHDAAQIHSLDFESVIQNDIEYVRSRGIMQTAGVSENRPADGSTEIYGERWGDFLLALRSIGCGYWADLYAGIFQDDFVLDKTALEQRLSVPAEVMELGAASVGRWLEELEYGSELLNEARVIILGDKGSGKTSLAWRIVDPLREMPTDDQSTDGVDVSIWQPDDSDVKVHIWDFAGHSVTHAAHRFFMSERCVYIIVYDGRLDSGSKSLEYWFENVEAYGGNSPVFVVINEKDTHIDSVQEHILQDKYGKSRVLEFVRFSVKSNQEALERFRNQLLDQIAVDMALDRTKVPREVFRIKTKLEQQFIGGNQLHMDNYMQLAQPLTRQRSKKEAREALLFLSALGVCLWYPKIERFHKLVLNPSWITHGVYRIINWLKETKQHVLFESSFDDIFSTRNDHEYLQEKAFLWDLLKEYQLAYESGNCLEVPTVMPQDAPRRGMADDFPARNSLYMYYLSESDLPADTITRFIVRHHDLIFQGDVWRYGVHLLAEGCEALVFESNRKIEVLVKGARRTEFLTSLRNTLDDIFKTYKRKAPDHMYRVIDENDWESEVLEEEVILRYYRKQQEYLGKNGGLNMASTVSNYNIENHGGVVQTGNQNTATISTQTINYSQMNEELQPLLNALLRVVKDQPEHTSEVSKLKSAIEALEETENTDIARAKKKGVGETLKNAASFIGRLAKEGIELAIKALPLVTKILEAIGN